MSSALIQRIDCEVTFLRDTERGPLAWPKALSGGKYRPHLVVGDASQRRAVLTSRPLTVTRSDGSKAEITTHNYIDEEYLGVQFDEGLSQPEIETPLRVTLSLMYWPHPGYDKLQPGATFTVREGPTIVGYGKVLSWRAASTAAAGAASGSAIGHSPSLNELQRRDALAGVVHFERP